MNLQAGEVKGYKIVCWNLLDISTMRVLFVCLLSVLVFVHSVSNSIVFFLCLPASPLVRYFVGFNCQVVSLSVWVFSWSCGTAWVSEVDLDGVGVAAAS
jgi:hypothetical protein